MPLCCTANKLNSPRLINREMPSGSAGAESIDFGTATFADQSSATKLAIAVLDFELHDLTLTPGLTEEQERTASIAPISQRPIADFTVEVKGTQKRLTEKGVQTLAAQIVAAINEA